MEIRKFIREDTESVVQLWKECNLTRPWNGPYKDIERKCNEQPDQFLVATEGILIIGTGMCGYDGHRGWVYYLGVLEGYQRKGVARALMNRFESMLVSIGCPKVQLMVRDDNVSAIKFYNNIGYSDSSVKVFGKRLIPDD